MGGLTVPMEHALALAGMLFCMGTLGLMLRGRWREVGAS
jgi:NADH:ubiquinone oxidoreductase subunit K